MQNCARAQLRSYTLHLSRLLSRPECELKFPDRDLSLAREASFQLVSAGPDNSQYGPVASCPLEKKRQKLKIRSFSNVALLPFCQAVYMRCTIFLRVIVPSMYLHTAQPRKDSRCHVTLPFLRLCSPVSRTSTRAHSNLSYTLKASKKLGRGYLSLRCLIHHPADVAISATMT